MDIKSRFKTLLFPALLAASGAGQAVTVQFSGKLDAANTGPFTAGDTFSGSFVIDETVTPNNGIFSGAIDDFVLNIAGYTLTGENGRLNQFSSGNGDTDFMAIKLGGASNPQGTVNGNAGTDVFTGFTADWRGGSLFGDKNVPAHDLTWDDFSYYRVTFEFNNNVLDTVIDDATGITVGPLSAVPLPAGFWLLGSGLLGLLGWARRSPA